MNKYGWLIPIPSHSISRCEPAIPEIINISSNRTQMTECRVLFYIRKHISSHTNKRLCRPIRFALLFGFVRPALVSSTFIVCHKRATYFVSMPTELWVWGGPKPLSCRRLTYLIRTWMSKGMHISWLLHFVCFVCLWLSSCARRAFVCRRDGNFSGFAIRQEQRVACLSTIFAQL